MDFQFKFDQGVDLRNVLNSSNNKTKMHIRMNPHFPRKVNYQLCWRYSIALWSTSKRFLSILYFETYDKVFYGIANRFQQPDVLIYKSIPVFVRLCNWNYDQSICVVAAICETDFKLGDFY